MLVISINPLNKKSMKRLLFTAFCAFVLISSAKSQEKEVILHPTVLNGNSVGNHTGRTPIRTPEVYIDDYTLIFDTSFEGFTIELLQDEEVVYSDIIDENGEVQLPDNLVGEYELRFCVGSFTFVGEIDL